MSFRAVADAGSLWDGEMRGLDVDGRKVLLVRIEGAVHAYEDRCLHKGIPLSEGLLKGRVLTCWAHAWEYDACTGHGRNPPTPALHRFPVRVDADQIWVDIDV